MNPHGLKGGVVEDAYVAFTDISVENLLNRINKLIVRDEFTKNMEKLFISIKQAFNTTKQKEGWRNSNILNKILIVAKKFPKVAEKLSKKTDFNFLMLDNNFGRDAATHGNIYTIDHHEDYDLGDYKSAAPKVIDRIIANHCVSADGRFLNGKTELTTQFKKYEFERKNFNIKDGNSYLITNNNNFDVDGLLCMYAALFPSTAKAQVDKVRDVTYFTDYEMFGKYDYSNSQSIEPHTDNEILGLAIMSFIKVSEFKMDRCDAYRSIVYVLPWLMSQDRDVLNKIAKIFLDDVTLAVKTLREMNSEPQFWDIKDDGAYKAGSTPRKIEGCLLKINDQNDLNAIAAHQQLAVSMAKFSINPNKEVQFFILFRKIDLGYLVNIAPKWVRNYEYRSNQQLALSDTLKDYFTDKIAAPAAFREEILLTGPQDEDKLDQLTESQNFDNNRFKIEDYLKISSSKKYPQKSF